MVRGVAGNLAYAGAAWLVAWLCSPAYACELSPTETATVAGSVDGETLRLTDGRTVRLTGAKAPMPPLGWRGDDPWPRVEEVNAELESLALAKPVELGFSGRRSDRHGHLLAQVYVVAGGERLWLQQAMIARGLARVYSLPDSRACAAELLAREREARARRVGIWSSWAYRIVQATDLERLGRLVHSYQLVEGEVVAVGKGAGRLYLNFAQDWRSDFTVSVERKQVGAFAAAGIELRALAGKRLRVRGTLAWRNGPMIEASHPEQIELLAEAPPKDETRPRLKQTGPSIAL